MNFMDGEQALFEQFVNFKWLQNVLFHSVKDEAALVNLMLFLNILKISKFSSLASWAFFTLKLYEVFRIK